MWPGPYNRYLYHKYSYTHSFRLKVIKWHHLLKDDRNSAGCVEGASTGVAAFSPFHLCRRCFNRGGCVYALSFFRHPGSKNKEIKTFKLIYREKETSCEIRINRRAWLHEKLFFRKKRSPYDQTRI